MAWAKVLVSGSVVNADIASSAAIAWGKMAALTASQVAITNSSGVITTEARLDAYNKDFGETAGTVAEGNHTHPGSDVKITGITGNLIGTDGSSLYDTSLNVSSVVKTSQQIIAGVGLDGGGALTGDVTLVVHFGGTGSEARVARSDHNHSTTYHPLGGSSGTDFETNNLIINGTLSLLGDIDQVTVTDLNVTDKRIVLAESAHSDALADGAGIVVDNSSTDANRPEIYWSDTSGEGWMIKFGESIITGNASHYIMHAVTAASDPAVGKMGMMYYNTSNASWYVYVA